MSIFKNALARTADSFSAPQIIGGIFLAVTLVELIIAGCCGTRDAPFTRLLWCLAFLTSGVLLGFLFGIPKSLSRGVVTAVQKPATPPVAGEAAGEAAASASRVTTQQLQTNTNLEEISDWLTKTVVGVSLVQLYKAPALLRSAGELVAGSAEPAALGTASALVVVFSTSGFFFGYLLTRLFLQGALNDADQRLNTLAEQVNDVQKEVGDVKTFARKWGPILEADPKTAHLAGKPEPA